MRGVETGPENGGRNDLDAIAALAWPGRAVGREAGAAIALRESNRAGTTTRVQTELKAKGLYRPGLPPGDTSGEAKMPKPLAVEIETRFIFHERFVEVGGKGTAEAARVGQVNRVGYQVDSGRAQRAVRHVIEAVLAVNGEVRMMSALHSPGGQAPGRRAAGTWRPRCRDQSGRSIDLGRARAGARARRPVDSGGPATGKACGRGRALAGAQQRGPGAERV